MRALTPFVFGFLVSSIAAPSGAQDMAYISADGHQYDLECNANGMVLTSRHPVSRFSGTGAMTEVTTGIENIFLGKSCDAAHGVYGEGTWGWANGGFGAEFPDYRIMFPRQELSCPDEMPYAGACPL